MPETISVPLTGTNVTPQGDVSPHAQTAGTESGFIDGVYQPPSKRVSIHRVRMARQAEQAEQHELAPQWVAHPGGQGGRFEYRQVERREEPSPATPPPQSAQPDDAVSQQIGQLTNAVELLARHQLGLPPDDRPRMPDPEDFDFYDPQQKAEFYRQNTEFVEAVVQHRKQTEIDPYIPTLQNIQRSQEMQYEFDQLVAERGNDPDFKRIMSAALDLITDSNNTLSVKDAFAKADRGDNRPGEKGGHLPQALRGWVGPNGKMHMPSLKDIVIHNQVTGRSRGR